MLDEVIYISHSVDIHGKDMNPLILSPAMSKYLDRLDSLALEWQSV